jgi:glycosyltransferase involved in cell wall biosynthesis
MMRIGISTRGLNQGSFAISTIIYHLTKNILELASKDTEIYLYFNDPEYEHLFSSGIHKRSIKMNNRFVWDHFWLPDKMRADKIDIALFMKGTIPPSLSCDAAVIMHDMGYFNAQLQPYKFLETLYMKVMIARAAKKATKIFTVSEHTRNEVTRILGIDPAKITTIYPDCSPIFKPVIDLELLERVRQTYRLPDRFIFWPTSLSPRKNISRILDVFEPLFDQIPQRLVITGGKAWNSKDFFQRVKSDFSDHIKILGNVSQDHMPALYTMADFTIYPSLLEGFGFPILESFRCGRTVLTSNIASMPEIAGGAAYLVDPYNSEEITAGIYRLATDVNFRHDLEEKGLARSKLFSWGETSASILSGLLIDP